MRLTSVLHASYIRLTCVLDFLRRPVLQQYCVTTAALWRFARAAAHCCRVAGCCVHALLYMHNRAACAGARPSEDWVRMLEYFHVEH